MRTPELLLPAGGLDKMRAAYDFGADAVYAGQPRYSLRARNNEFKLQQLEQGIQEAKARGKKFFVTSNLLAHNDKVRHVLMDPSGTRFYTASGDRTIKLWELTPGDTPTIRRAHTFRGHDEAVFGIALSPAADALASTAFKYRTKVWDLKAEMPFYQPPDIAFHAGRELAAGPVGRDVAVWDARTDYRVATLSGHTDDVNKVAFSPDGAYLASFDVVADGDNVLRLWSIPDGAAAGSVTVSESKIQFAPLNDGKQVLISQGGTLRVVKVEDGSASLEQPITGVFVIDGAGAQVAFAAPAEEKGSYAIQLLNLSSLAVSALTALPSTEAPKLAWNNAGDTLAVSQWEKPDPDVNKLSVQLLPLAGTAPTVLLSGFKSSIKSFAFDTDDSIVAVGNRNTGDIELYEVSTGILKSTLQGGHSTGVYSLAFSPDGTRLASASLDGTFLLWDPVEGRQVLTVHNAVLETAGQAITPDYVAFNAKGDLLATLMDGAQVPPYVLKTFPWDVEQYPAGETLQDRVETYKRNLKP